MKRERTRTRDADQSDIERVAGETQPETRAM